MTSVDAFLQFIVEELAKEGTPSVVLGVSLGEGEPWTVKSRGGNNDSEALGDNLAAALNILSMQVDFTSKELNVAEEPSLAKRVAELAALHGASLTLQAPRSKINWTVRVPELGLQHEAFTLDTALQLLLDDLIGLGK